MNAVPFGNHRVLIHRRAGHGVHDRVVIEDDGGRGDFFLVREEDGDGERAGIGGHRDVARAIGSGKPGGRD